jgi:uncharacterized membrane protein
MSRPVRELRPSPVTTVDDLVDLFCLMVVAALVITAALDEASTVRAIAAGIFVLFVPGRALTTNLSGPAARSIVASSVLLSLTTLIFVATIALWVHAWHPLDIFYFESGLVVIALIVGLVRRHRVRRVQA